MNLGVCDVHRVHNAKSLTAITIQNVYKSIKARCCRRCGRSKD
jgi:hypothetical protein